MRPLLLIAVVLVASFVGLKLGADFATLRLVRDVERSIAEGGPMAEFVRWLTSLING